jgi:hypothetical protein
MKDDTSFSRGERCLSRIFLIFFEHFLPPTVTAEQKRQKMKELTDERSSESARRTESGRKMRWRESFF